MTTLRISFEWDDEGGMSYDELMERLIFMGADNIEDEEVALSTEGAVEGPPRRKKK